MSLAQKISDLAARVGVEIKAVRVEITSALSRANHTGTQTASTISDFNTAADARVNALVVAATETVSGKVELATVAESTTGTDTTRAVTPAGVKAVADTKANTSHTHTASQVTDFNTAADARVNALVPVASETAAGKVELATTAEATTGTDTTRAVTPAGVKAVGDTKAALSHTHTASQITDFNTAADARVNALVPSSSETAAGKVELATVAEATTGTDTARAVTPAGVKAVGDTKAALSHTHTASQVTDFNSSADARIAAASATGSGALVRATSPTLVTPALGTPSSVVLTNGIGLPAPGGISATGTPSATTFLRGDGQWATPAGGGGTPGGATTQVQFNDAGAFGGDADLTWNKTTNTLGLPGADTGIELKGITNEPGTIGADTLRVYSKKIAGKMVPKVKGPSGIDSPIQNSLWGNNVMFWGPSTATGGTAFGTSYSTAGTYATLNPSFSTTLFSTIQRNRYSNVVTTANQALGVRTANALVARGSTVGGGFFFASRAGFETWTNGGRAFFGMFTGTTGIITADPSATANICGFASEVADNGLIYFMSRNSGTTSKVSTGFTIVSGKGYDCYIHCAPGGSNISWRIVDINTGAEVSGVESTNLPVNTTTMCAGVYASNAALTPVNSIQLSVARIYVETDY